MFRIFLLLGLGVIFCSFFLSLSRLLNCLIVIENLNVLILFSSLILHSGSSFVFFIALIVIFTIEVVLGLVVLTRLWSSSGLADIVGW